jgi:hypothetical protein
MRSYPYRWQLRNETNGDWSGVATSLEIETAAARTLKEGTANG